MKKMWAPSHWKIVEGTVDSKGEYIFLTYKNNPTVLALVSPGENKTFIVQYPIKDTETMKKYDHLIKYARSWLRYHLITRHKANAWFYAISLCSKDPYPKLYIHWNYHPKEGDK